VLFALANQYDIAFASSRINAPERNLQAVHYPKMGVCEDNVSEEYRCAMESIHCSSTEKWINAADLIKGKKIKSSAACICDENTAAGVCAKGTPGNYYDHRCAPSARACDDACPTRDGPFPCTTDPTILETFLNETHTLPDGQKCTCSHIMAPSQAVTDDSSMVEYGMCAPIRGGSPYGQGAWCASGPDDCGDTSFRYQDAVITKRILGYACTCDMVHLGGCRGSGGYDCAINEDSCERGTRYGITWYAPEYFQFKTGMNCRLCKPTSNTATESDGFIDEGVDETEKSDTEIESGTNQSDNEQSNTDQSGGYEPKTDPSDTEQSSPADETRVQSTSANEKANVTVQTAPNNTPIIVLGVLAGVLSVGVAVMSVLYVRTVKKQKTREIEIGSLQSVN